MFLRTAICWATCIQRSYNGLSVLWLVVRWKQQGCVFICIYRKYILVGMCSFELLYENSCEELVYEKCSAVLCARVGNFNYWSFFITVCFSMPEKHFLDSLVNSLAWYSIEQ